VWAGSPLPSACEDPGKLSNAASNSSPVTLLLLVQEEFFIKFAEFEEKVKEVDRARAIYK
jgi:hypothetical protein